MFPKVPKGANPCTLNIYKRLGEIKGTPLSPQSQHLMKSKKKAGQGKQTVMNKRSLFAF